jgi:hypothetical protein
MSQDRVQSFHESVGVQTTLAFLICLKFGCDIVESQLRPELFSEAKGVFYNLELAFSVIFALELCAHMYGSLWTRFWSKKWNWFDFVVIAVSPLSSARAHDRLVVLRVFRFLRVVRLFKRVPLFKLIFEGILASLPGMLGAFSIMGTICCMWSVIGVNPWAEVDVEHFGTLLRGMLT